VSYQSQAQLTDDVWFNARSSSCATQQAETFKNDQRAAYVAVAEAVLRGEGIITSAFARLAAAGPGIADKVDNGDGTISQENVTDADLLSLTQANWPSVAELFYAADGTPLP
jgi:hypothetical protein